MVKKLGHWEFEPNNQALINIPKDFKPANEKPIYKTLVTSIIYSQMTHPYLYWYFKTDTSL